nr:PREDICTED: taste receptor type 2 member 40-like [Latimeria chalumnae]|eukprot:XP_006013749.1 PREDICTED: taste receptor type 2 member 40-like [Latimeria chalumnae]
MTVRDTVFLSVDKTLLWFGSTWNTFIVLAYFLEYRRSQTLQPYEVIIMLIALSNLLMELSSVSWLVILFLELCAPLERCSSKCFAYLLPKSMVWLTALLCCVYCVKIVKVNWRFFLRLKQKISLFVKFMIFLTLLLLISFSLPVHTRIRFNYNSTNMCKHYFIIEGKEQVSVMVAAILSFFTSFLLLAIMLVSSLCIVVFLCLHSRNIDKNITPSSTSRGEAHTSVAIMLLCRIALYITCVATAQVVNIEVSSGNFDRREATAVTELLFTGWSPIILIIGIMKLRKVFLKLCFSKGVKVQT